MSSEVGNMKYFWIYRMFAHQLRYQLRPLPPAEARRNFIKGPFVGPSGHIS